MLCSYLTFAFDGKDQRKTQTQTLSVNKALKLIHIDDLPSCPPTNSLVMVIIDYTKALSSII